MASKTTKNQAKKQALFDTGVESKEQVTILIPGRGKVKVPNPRGDLYFDGSHTKDTGPTHVKDVKGNLYFDGAYTKDTSPAWVNNSTTGDLHFRGSYIKDTGPSHVQKISSPIEDPDYTRSGPVPPYEFSLSGILSRKDYLYLARRGCTMKNSVLVVPAEKVVEVCKYLKLADQKED